MTFALQYAITKLQETNFKLYMNFTRQILAYEDDVHLEQ